jgi:hypothetical protein
MATVRRTFCLRVLAVAAVAALAAPALTVAGQTAAADRARASQTTATEAIEQETVASEPVAPAATPSEPTASAPTGPAPTTSEPPPAPPPSRATPSAATPSAATPSAATPSAAIPSGAKPSGGEATPTPVLDAPFAFDGPPAPAAPAVVSRDAEGRVTVRAVRLTAPIRLDGRLDEAVYTTVPAISDFIQQDPQEGPPATEKTEAWLFFDDDTFYVMFRVWESRPEAVIANEMRRDSNGIFQNDHVAFLIDPFYDRRNGIEIAINALGGRWDGQVTNERNASGDWNPIWNLRVGRFENGWTVETAIPFKSLRYRQGRAQIWGFNVRRVNRGKNETSFLTRVPRAMGQQALFRASLAATMVGLEVPQGSRNLEIKPYAVSGLTTDVTATPQVSNDASKDVGVDLRYGLTQNISADITYNTDFAQVEADEQQVNLTRFNLFFPEKREFFLENQGIFAFGGAATGSATDIPILFYSRRIGVDRGRAVPIEIGGRVTGRAGRYTLGLINITSDNEVPDTARRTNFSVARVKRDIWRRSSIGLMATTRSRAEQTAGGNQVFGMDGNFAFFNNLAVNAYVAKTETPGLGGRDTSLRGQLDYAGDRYGVQVEQLNVGEHFNPDIGFVRRTNVRKSFALFRFSPRPRAIPRVRRLSWITTGTYIENGNGRVDTRDWSSEFAFEFQNSDRFAVSYGATYEFLPQPLRIVGLTVPVGGYDYQSGAVAMNFGRQRAISGNVSLEHGTFYGGHKTTLAASQGRYTPTAQLALEPTYQGNWVDLPQGVSRTHLVGTRITYTVNPRMFTSALVQYNTGVNAVSANMRLRWEYRPGSELFVVYNEQRDTLATDFPGLMNRALIVKVNRLFRF